MSRNNIRGPTSALTEFLKASGITATTIARRVATRNQPENTPQPGPSRRRSNDNANESVEAGPSSSNGTRPRRASRRSGYVSDELDEQAEEDAMDVDEEEEEEAAPVTKKRKLTKAAEAKLKAKEKEKMKGKKGHDDENENDEDEDKDAYTALSKSLWKNTTPKPPVGSFEKCAACGKQFTVTKYTLAANNGRGFLCHQCAKAGGQDPFKKPAAPKKRKAPSDKRNVVNFEEKRFPTLVSICIQLITRHINDIDALGDIGTMNVEAIAKALSKNRGLTPENVKLFYSASNSSLTLFDATNLPSPALETLAYHNANLVSLRLDFCGHLDDAAMKVFCSSFPSLRRLELLGPFLVRPAAWQDFFKSHPKLEGFLITQSPRFDDDCIKALVKSCPKITELRLKEIGQMKDHFLGQIKLLKNGLDYLDLSDPSQSCSEKAWIDLLRTVGKTLTHLNVSKHDLLADNFLIKGLIPYTKTLLALNISHLSMFTDAGVSKFFDKWKGAPLVSLDISRNEALASATLESILQHSGEKLQNININGLKDIDEDSLKMIAKQALELKTLDVGFCRAVNDFVVQEWLEGTLQHGIRSCGCRHLQEIKVWGCNRVSSSCPKKKGVVIYGVESHVAR